MPLPQCKLLVSFLSAVFTSFNHLPVLGGANRSLGFLFGLLTGMLDVCLVMCIVWAVMIVTSGQLPFLNEGDAVHQLRLSAVQRHQPVYDVRTVSNPRRRACFHKAAWLEFQRRRAASANPNERVGFHVVYPMQKRQAIVFVQRMEAAETKNEGYCLTCARELHIKPSGRYDAALRCVRPGSGGHGGAHERLS